MDEAERSESVDSGNDDGSTSESDMGEMDAEVRAGLDDALSGLGSRSGLHAAMGSNPNNEAHVSVARSPKRRRPVPMRTGAGTPSPSKPRTKAAFVSDLTQMKAAVRQL